MLVSSLLVLLGGCSIAVARPRWYVPLDPPHVEVFTPSEVTVEDCPGYVASNIATTGSSLTADLKLAGTACNVYGQDLTDLKLLVEYQTDERLHVKIYDSAIQVYQVQEQVLPRPPQSSTQASSAILQFNYVEEPFSFSVVRKENNETLFDTSGTQLIFESQYVRLRTKLPQNPNLYGLGEHSDPFRLPTTNYQRVMWNSESPFIPNNANLYGSHPVYFEHRADKGTHGVFLLNSNAMNININNTAADGQYLEYNTVGGVIDLYFLGGKTPTQVSQQYAETVGLPAFFPYWALGFHQCKYGYWDINMVAEVVANYSTANIPLEVMWTDIDYMNLRQDFTTDPERFPLHKYRELIDTLHARNQRYVLILDPGIHAVSNYSTYTRGHEQGVFLKTDVGTDYLGVQWAGVEAWPDWLAPNTQNWWTNEIKNFFSEENGVNLDGLWVDMNEASNFCSDPTCDPVQAAIDGNDPPQPTNAPRNNTGRVIPGFPADFQPDPNATTAASAAATSSSANSKRSEAAVEHHDMSLYSRQSDNGTAKGLPDREWFYPPYHINNHRGNLPDYTIWTNITNADGTRQYDTHNFYGHTMASTTRNAMISRRPGLRPFVLTRSTFAGSGRNVAHWFGDNASNWEHYRTTIRQMLAFVAVHAMPMVGSDVCGFNDNADEYMCARWAMLGAFQPFYRNHAEISARQQEFYQWNLTAAAARKAIDARYRLLDFMYTALYYQTSTGEPSVNPLFYVYPSDGNTFSIQHQWFYGTELLISPVTDDYSDTVTFYLPDDQFYDFWDYTPISGSGANITRSNVSYTDIPVHIRGGSILPLRSQSANTTKLLRQQDFTIVVAPGRNGTAEGRLYLDDGESLDQPNASEIKFSWDGQNFAASGSFGYRAAAGESVTVSQVLILGQQNGGGNGSVGVDANGVKTVKGPWVLGGAFGFKA